MASPQLPSPVFKSYHQVGHKSQSEPSARAGVFPETGCPEGREEKFSHSITTQPGRPHCLHVISDSGAYPDFPVPVKAKPYFFRCSLSWLPVGLKASNKHTLGRRLRAPHNRGDLISPNSKCHCTGPDRGGGLSRINQRVGSRTEFRSPHSHSQDSSIVRNLMSHHSPLPPMVS